MNQVIPPGHPGISPRWTSSAKSGVGTSISDQSRVWFTVSHGIIDEVYYPRIDQVNTRDMGFLVTDRKDFFSEEKRHTNHEIAALARGVPGYRLVNTCVQGRYRITKTIVTDPRQDALLLHVQFEPLQGTLDDYALYVLLAPHIGNAGYGNNGHVGDYKGVPMLFAERGATALALACSAGFGGMSCGYVGVSDGWQDINQHHRMTWFYTQANDGNIALMGEIDVKACGGTFVLSLAFGQDDAEAGLRARAALLRDFDEATQSYIHEWQQFQKRCLDLDNTEKGAVSLYRVSTAVLKTHLVSALEPSPQAARRSGVSAGTPAFVSGWPCR